MVPAGRQPGAPRPIDVDLRVEALPPVEPIVAIECPAGPPIFVVGDRSGDLGAHLDAHGNVSFTPGPGLLPGFLRTVSENRDALSRYGYPEQYWLQSIARYYAGVQGDHAASRGRARWATGAPDDDVDLVDRLYPRCQILHVTGDRGSWARSRRARAAGARLLPGRYCEIAHADLIADPDATMRKVLTFLGEA